MAEKKPVIFLAFANDRRKNGNYLSDLPMELRGLQDILQKAEDAGLCEIVGRNNATRKEVIDLFQRAKYRDRIAIFHFGGHAAETKLLLENEVGAPESAYQEGFVSFLSKQKGLTLVFLNGCCTKKHAQSLIQADVPVVIGTEGKIPDWMASDLAQRFYSGIAAGLPLERAWQEAVAEIQTQSKSQADKHEFSWEIYFKRGAEEIKHWNLPDESGNPLFGLPPLPDRLPLPSEPYHYLKRYKELDAGIFFGRSLDIRRLYSLITASNDAPVILLYGQSGVGKSSLLEAGLIPRLKAEHEILIIREHSENGLLGSLERKLVDRCQELMKQSKKEFPDLSGPALNDVWCRIEALTKRPLTIILDQVEEVFIPGAERNSSEYLALSAALTGLFANPDLYPQGKLLLVYRKEFHPEVESPLNTRHVYYAEHYLDTLMHEGIVEVVRGLTSTTRLQNKYQLEVEDRLPEIISDNLLADGSSPTAPTLQIVLTRMWRECRKDTSKPARKFSVAFYRELEHEGLMLEDFFDRQMETLEQRRPKAVRSGLALDVLVFHTTAQDTARNRTDLELQPVYSHLPNMINGLVEDLKDLYLLTHSYPNFTRIAHDTLAPIIRKKYTESDRPGQRAAHILASKTRNSVRPVNEIFLDEADLAVVEQGRAGMRMLTEKESELLAQSKRKLMQIRTRQRGLILMLAILTVLLPFLIFKAVEAGKKDKAARANRLATLARIKLAVDPVEALKLAEEAYYLNANDSVAQVLSAAASETLHRPLFNSQFKHKYIVNSARFSPSGDHVLTASADKTAQLWRPDGQAVQTFPHPDAVGSAVFSTRGDRILTFARCNSAFLWDINGYRIADFLHEERLNSACFSPVDDHLMTASDDRTVRLWNQDGRESARFSFESAVNYAAFSDDGGRILTGTHKKKCLLMDLNGNILADSTGVNSALLSPDGNYLVMIMTDNKIRLRDLENNSERVITGLPNIATHATVSPQGGWLATAFLDGSVRLYDLLNSHIDGEDGILLKGHTQMAAAVVFSPDSKEVLTASLDGTAILWDLQAQVKARLEGHGDAILGASFSADGTRILTASRDYTAKLWDLKDQMCMDIISMKEPFIKACLSPNGSRVLAVGHNFVLLTDLRGRVIARMDRHKKWVHSARFSRDGSRIVTASADQTAVLWDEQGRYIKTFSIHKGNVSWAEFSPDGRFLLTASYDNTARLHALNGAPSIIMKHKDSLISARFSPDGTKILTATFGDSAHLWDVHGKELTVFKQQLGQVRVAIFSADGNRVFTASGYARIWDLKGNVITTLEKIQKVKNKLGAETTAGIIDAVFSSCGRYLLTATDGSRASLWDMEGRLKATFVHTAAVNQATFSADGRLVVTASDDGTVKLWSLEGNLLADIKKHTKPVLSAWFSNNDRQILSASADGTVKLHDTPSGIINRLKKREQRIKAVNLSDKNKGD